MSKVSLVKDGTVATITIRIPERKNAMDREAVNQFIDCLREVEYNSNIRCVVVTGGDDAFCAGADVKERQGVDSIPDVPADIERHFHEIVRIIMRMKKPVIAKVRGPAVGAGACIATACDYVYAEKDALFGFVFVNIGLAVDSGVSFILPRLVGLRTAIELVFSGEIFDGDRAEQLGLINEAVPDSDLDEVVAARAGTLASGPTRAYGEIKRLFLRGTHSTMEEMLDAESTAQGVIFHSDDRQEGMDAFGDGRNPEFQGR